jgi:uncharacterized protein YecE (DUF72 family)
MEFGRVDEPLENIDFTLPPDTELTTRTLGGCKNDKELSVFVGASKWGEKNWKGKIYPKQLPDKEFLGVYAQNFNTVEFGPSFYRIFKPEEISRWTSQVIGSPEFRFCPKFPQAITHIRRLANAKEYTTQFYDGLSAFGSQLGPLILQLPDNFRTKSFPQLKAYLESLPTTFKVNVEVRNQEWFSNATYRKDLFDLLAHLNIGTVISDTAGRRDCVHMELTTTDAVIRFVGNNLADSDFRRMNDWVDRLKVWTDHGLKSLWFFMHQNDERYVPDACAYLIDQLNDKLRMSIKAPQLIKS